MNDAKIKSDYLKKIKKINELNESYYNNNRPLIPDSKYDLLKKEIIDLEKQYNFLSHKDSPSKIVGFKPSKNFKKIQHKVPMLSLSNAFSETDLINFEKKIFNFLDKKGDFKIQYSAEPKIDGISASLVYKNGKFVTGLSRGDGKEGEDITENLKTIKDIPHTITSKDFPDEIDIRGEVFIKNSDFKKLSDNFANPRNAASGSLRQKNPNDTKKIPLKFIAYTFGFVKGMKISNQSDFLKKLSEWGFKTNPFNKLIEGVNNLMINYDKIEKKRNELDFDIDGIVYKINNFQLQKRLGNVANAPRWAIAHKFSANSGVSKIVDIDIQIGRTGALTPVAKINPINIGGVLVSNATLHNEDEINRKDIRIGDTVKIERAGDVIPHVVEVDLKKRKANSKKFIFPKKCPCGFETIKEFNKITKKFDAVRRCPDRGFDCDRMAKERLKHFVSKDAFNIEGLGKKVIEKFWSLGLIKFPYDIFNLDYDKISQLDGWGNRSVENLKKSIKKSEKVSLEKFIFSLGIRHIGQENAKLLSEFLRKKENFLRLKNQKYIQELINIDGIGDTQINSLKMFFNEKVNLNVILNLSRSLDIQGFKESNNSGKLKGQVFMFTGKLNNISRAEAKSLIESNGGKIVSNVTKKLDYLVIGEKPTTKKVDLAKKNKIKVINQKTLDEMLN